MFPFVRITVNIEDPGTEDEFFAIRILRGRETPQSTLINGEVKQTDKISIEGYEKEWEALMGLEVICEGTVTGLFELLLLRGFQQGIKYQKSQK